MSFIHELSRRNVIRMAGLYLVGAWLVAQVAGTILPMFGAPDWVARTVVILLAIGFVPALVLAWVFELTPEGLKRDSELPAAESIAPQTARRMDRMSITTPGHPHDTATPGHPRPSRPKALAGSSGQLSARWASAPARTVPDRACRIVGVPKRP